MARPVAPDAAVAATAPRRTRRTRPVAWAGGTWWRALVAVAVVLVAVAPVVPASGAAGADATPWSVTAAPTSNLTDGQTVTVTVRSTVDFPLYSAELHLCRAGVAYSTSSGARPDADFARGGANCPLTPVSSSADPEVVDTRLLGAVTQPAGEVIRYRVGTGTTNWSDTASNEPRTLTCDPTHPCALVVELLGGPGAPQWFPVVVQVSFKDDNPITGCGGPADGILNTAGSDRVSDLWIDVTLAACKQGQVVGAPSRATFVGEGTAVRGFADGSYDLAYTAAGLDPTVGLVDGEGAGVSRPSVAVPVGLNATVLAIGNGRPGPNGRKVPFSDIKLTLDEVATMLSGGTYAMAPYLDAITARNPELADAGVFNTASSFVVGATADADTGSWLMTHHLTQLRPGVWRVPSLGTFGADAGRTRGASASLALADPNFSNALTLLSGRPALRKNVSSFGGSDFGGAWVLTDLATARALELTPVSIENAAGTFVAPTPASLAAAVPTMRRGAAGTLLADPSATAPVGGVTPYPLTQVEYALAPTEHLVDESCVARPSSDAVLRSWLGYLTTAGQAQLPAGFAPLTPALSAEAAQAIPTVAASASSRNCPAAPPTAPADPATTATGTAGAGGSASGAPPGELPGDIPSSFASLANDAFLSSPFSDSSFDNPTSEVDPAAATGAKAKRDEVAIEPAVALPRFGEGRVFSSVAVVTALIVLLVGFALLVRVSASPRATGAAAGAAGLADAGSADAGSAGTATSTGTEPGA